MTLGNQDIYDYGNHTQGLNGNHTKGINGNPTQGLNGNPNQRLEGNQSDHHFWDMKTNKFKMLTIYS